MGSLIKTVFAKNIGVKPEQIVTVGIMPCVAKKDEIERPQLRMRSSSGQLIKVRCGVGVGGSSFGVHLQETDYVLTTRELGRLIRDDRSIAYASLAASEYDRALGLSTGAAALFGATGGVMEAAVRTAHFFVTGQELPDPNVLALRPVNRCTFWLLVVCGPPHARQHTGVSLLVFAVPLQRIPIIINRWAALLSAALLISITLACRAFVSFVVCRSARIASTWPWSLVSCAL